MLGRSQITGVIARAVFKVKVFWIWVSGSNGGGGGVSPINYGFDSNAKEQKKWPDLECQKRCMKKCRATRRFFIGQLCSYWLRLLFIFGSWRWGCFDWANQKNDISLLQKVLQREAEGRLNKTVRSNLCTAFKAWESSLLVCGHCWIFGDWLHMDIQAENLLESPRQ